MGIAHLGPLQGSLWWSSFTNGEGLCTCWFGPKDTLNLKRFVTKGLKLVKGMTLTCLKLSPPLTHISSAWVLKMTTPKVERADLPVQLCIFLASKTSLCTICCGFFFSAQCENCRKPLCLGALSLCLCVFEHEWFVREKKRAPMAQEKSSSTLESWVPSGLLWECGESSANQRSFVGLTRARALWTLYYFSWSFWRVIESTLCALDREWQHLQMSARVWKGLEKSKNSSM